MSVPLPSVRSSSIMAKERNFEREERESTHAERVSPSEGDNLLVVEAHAVKDVAEVVGGEGTVRETSSRWALRKNNKISDPCLACLGA